MPNDDRSADLIGYKALELESLRGVVRGALQRVAEKHGLPGDHHFYISFQTRAPMVSIPPELVSRYPDEMTIVLQNQFWDLKPGDTAFSVTLQFGGQPKSLSIPYAAITRFFDPHINYLIHFPPAPTPDAAAPVATVATAPFGESTTTDASKRVKKKGTEESEPDRADEPKVVSLRDFRKK